MRDRKPLVSDLKRIPLSKTVKARTLLALGFAVLVGCAAAVATYDMVGAGRPAHTPTSQEDSDPGLIP